MAKAGPEIGYKGVIVHTEVIFVATWDLEPAASSGRRSSLTNRMN